jgi:hypothetical protein
MSFSRDDLVRLLDGEIAVIVKNGVFSAKYFIVRSALRRTVAHVDEMKVVGRIIKWKPKER